MGVWNPGLPARGITRTEDVRTIVFNDRRLAGDDKQELVLSLVPMARRRLGSRFKCLKGKRRTD